jgi:hypothetical protein
MDSSLRNGEVDLLEATVKLVRFIINNLVWLILFPVIGLIGGYLMSTSAVNKYEGEMMLRTSLLTEDEVSFLLNGYKRAGFSGLAPDQPERVIEFSSRVYTKEKFVFAVVTTTVTDTSVLSNLERGIVTYLENEKLTQESLSTSQVYNKKMVQEYTASIQKGEALIAEKKDETLQSFTQLMLLIARRADHEKALSEKSAFKIVSGFQAIDLGVNKIRVILKGFIIGIFVSLIFLFVKFFVGYYRKANASAS